MTPSEHPHPVRPHGPIHLVVPKRPGADLDLLRAKLEGVPALQEHDVVWHVPDQRGDIVQLARDAAQAALADGGLVVAAGGDGTINAVASAALLAGVPLGVVPMGTFNYFSREHGLALDPETAVQDLLQALDEGQLSRAVLDVCEPEPLPPEHPFWHHPKVVLTPHIASMTQPETAVEAVIDNLRRHRVGKAPRS